MLNLITETKNDMPGGVLVRYTNHDIRPIQYIYFKLNGSEIITDDGVLLNNFKLSVDADSVLLVDSMSNLKLLKQIKYKNAFSAVSDDAFITYLAEYIVNNF